MVVTVTASLSGSEAARPGPGAGPGPAGRVPVDTASGTRRRRVDAEVRPGHLLSTRQVTWLRPGRAPRGLGAATGSLGGSAGARGCPGPGPPWLPAWAEGAMAPRRFDRGQLALSRTRRGGPAAREIPDSESDADRDAQLTASGNDHTAASESAGALPGAGT
jgi:hypothetical protein